MLYNIFYVVFRYINFRTEEVCDTSGMKKKYTTNKECGASNGADPSLTKVSGSSSGYEKILASPRMKPLHDINLN